MLDLAVVILTKDEKLHIQRCLEKLQPLEPKQIFLVDCFSTDGTKEIAEKMGATVIPHEWPRLYAVQFNWALDNCPINAKWVLRLDADEYLYPETIAEVKRILPTLPNHVTSLSLSRERAWMGKIIRRGGTGSVILKRFFRYGVGRCEQRMMDEHIITTEGDDILLKGAFVDDNLNDISWWAEKHIGYSTREAIDLLNIEYGFLQDEKECITGQAAEKRARKFKYVKLPLFGRSFAYFCLRYFIKGGFLEGKEGFLWHFMQGWWYRTLVDVRVWEIKKRVGINKKMSQSECSKKIKEYLRKNLSLKGFF